MKKLKQAVVDFLIAYQEARAEYFKKHHLWY